MVDITIALGIAEDGTPVNLYTGRDLAAAQKALLDAGETGVYAAGYVYRNPASVRRFHFDVTKPKPAKSDRPRQTGKA